MPRKTKAELEDEKQKRKAARKAREKERETGQILMRNKGNRIRGAGKILGTIPGSVASTAAFRAAKRAPKTTMELGALAIYGFEIRDCIKAEGKIKRELMDHITVNGDDPSNAEQKEIQTRLSYATKAKLVKIDEAIEAGVGTKKEIAEWVKANFNKESIKGQLDRAWQSATKENIKGVPRALYNAGLVNKATTKMVESGAWIYGKGRGITKGEDLAGRDERVARARAAALAAKKRGADWVSGKAELAMSKVKKSKKSELPAPAQGHTVVNRTTGEFVVEPTPKGSSRPRRKTF